jgi:hypothetical protein
MILPSYGVKNYPFLCSNFYSLIALLSYYRLETEVFLSDNFGLNTRLDVDIKLLNTIIINYTFCHKMYHFLMILTIIQSVKVPLLPSRIYCFTLLFLLQNIIWNKDYNQNHYWFIYYHLDQ